MVGERVGSLLNREPVIKQVSDAVTDSAHGIREVPDNAIQRNTPDIPRRNLGGGTLVGAVTAAVATVVEDTVGVPFGASSDIVDSESVEGGIKYTVNVNAPIETMAEARASIDSTTGFTSFLTDRIKVDNVEIEKTRILRDTFQVEVIVRD